MAEHREPTSSRTAFEGTVLRLDVEEWPGHPPHEVIHHLGAAAVLPLLPSNEVLLVKQFRPAVRQTLTEIPAGLLDVDGEDALTCAGRELFEETGYRSEATAFLGGTFLSPGFTAEDVHLFWARTAPEPVGEPEAGIEVVRMPLHRAITGARDGKVRNAMTA